MTETALERQARKIKQHRSRVVSFMKTLSGMNLIVLPKVFPGGTDTELLCDTIEIKPSDRVLDLCTGTGAVAIKAALAGAAQVVGTDINPDAIENANQNKALLGLNNVDFILTDVYPKELMQFDVITANPPYTDNETPDVTAAMFWDKDHNVLKHIFEKLDDFLAPEGHLLMTWPSFAPANLPESLAKQHGLQYDIVNRRSSYNSGFEYYVYRITRT